MFFNIITSTCSTSITIIIITTTNVSVVSDTITIVFTTDGTTGKNGGIVVGRLCRTAAIIVGDGTTSGVVIRGVSRATGIIIDDGTTSGVVKGNPTRTTGCITANGSPTTLKTPIGIIKIMGSAYPSRVWRCQVLIK